MSFIENPARSAFSRIADGGLVPKSFKSLISGAAMSALAVLPVKAQETPKPEIVDMHTVIAIDVSGSVDYTEQSAMMKGYALGLMSPEAKSDFDSGLHYAISLVYFGTKARHTITQIIHSSKDADDFAQKYLWDFRFNVPRSTPSDLGADTSTASSLIVAADLFVHEHDFGFESVNKSVMVSGDDNGPDYTAKDWTAALGQKFNATVYGIPVKVMEATNVGMEQNYKYSITTPKDLMFVSRGGAKSRVKEGISVPVNCAEDMEINVNNALRLTLY